MLPEDDQHANSHQLGLDPDAPVLVHSFWHSELFFTLCALFYGFGWCAGHAMPSAAAVSALLVSEECHSLEHRGNPGGGKLWTSMFLKSSVLISTTWGSQGNHFHMRASAEGLERSCRPRHTNCREWEQTHLSMQHSTAFWCSPER